MLGEKHVAIKVWDLPVRIFHWALTLLFVAQLVTGTIGGEMMAWHAWSGYAALVLIVFRILWGFVGSTHARFASFLAGPVATARFARRLFSRQAVPQVGHNPLGGWMVVLLLASFLLQAGTGLFANDGADVEGPLAVFVSIETSDRLSIIHRWNRDVLIVLTLVHVAAVGYHWLFKKENLLGAMFSGVKRVPESLLQERREPAQAEFQGNWRALAMLAIAVALVALVIRGPF